MHKHMALSIDEVIELTHLGNRITAVIPTGPAPIRCLMWSIFSLLLRSTPNDLMEHFVVCVNGPDKRTGDPALQDRKQAFLEELRQMQWYTTDNPQNKRDMPITVIRAWSRVGHDEAVEMAMPWIHTDCYLLLHDDTIIMTQQWEEEIKKKFLPNKNAALAYGSPELLFAHCDHCIAHGLYMLRVPHPYTYFLVARKSCVHQARAHWNHYNLGSPQNPIQFDLGDEVGDLDEFSRYYGDKGLLLNPPQTSDPYNFLNMGMGAWVYYQSCQNGFDTVALDPDIVEHLGGASRVHLKRFQEILDTKQEILGPLESQIAAHPAYGPLFE